MSILSSNYPTVSLHTSKMISKCSNLSGKWFIVWDMRKDNFDNSMLCWSITMLPYVIILVCDITMTTNVIRIWVMKSQCSTLTKNISPCLHNTLLGHHSSPFLNSNIPLAHHNAPLLYHNTLLLQSQCTTGSSQYFIILPQWSIVTSHCTIFTSYRSLVTPQTPLLHHYTPLL